MLKKLTTYLKITQQMGIRYMAFRVSYELKKKTGLFKKKFPIRISDISVPSLPEWHKNQTPFFQWNFDKFPELDRDDITKLSKRVDNLKKGKIELFGGKTYSTPLNEWHINPLTGYEYSKITHWSKIPEFTKEAGDIKYVWEKARFSWVYSFIRYDKHASQDSSKFIFDSIESFIDQNPINQGPNYICSQEISLRILNWVFALYYYKHSEALDEGKFHKILTSINAQIDHVYSNINFSRIAVRNNHALTETLTLYLTGLLFPFFPNAKKWKTEGKKWFEKEIEYQIYDDGSYLQYSMNYHRVVVQLLTWAFTLAKNSGEEFNPVVYEKAKKSVTFLEGCQDTVSGQLPHYGSNDGALFFPLNNLEYRNYTPQLNALKSSLNIPVSAKNDLFEDCFWYGLITEIAKDEIADKSTSFQFKVGGYYVWKEPDSLTFLRCGSHKNRPSQADNLHLDLWVNGLNILRDSGTYLYNGSTDEVAYYNSTRAHNTVQVGDEDQMRRGDRFIWFNWSKAVKVVIEETDDFWQFKGTILAFDNLELLRSVKKYKNQMVWEIEDEIHNKPKDKLMHQHWHPNATNMFITCKNEIGSKIKAIETHGWLAPNYGKSITSPILTFTTQGSFLSTRIEVTG